MGSSGFHSVIKCMREGKSKGHHSRSTAEEKCQGQRHSPATSPPTLQAIDVTKQDDLNTPYSFLKNEAGTPAEDVVFHVEAWAGGLSGAENVAKGAFK